MLWRPRGHTTWHEATSINTSRSGVYFSSRHFADIGTDVQLLLPMGHEHAASVDVADLLCTGRIVRISPLSPNESLVAIAATIDSYVFLREH